MRNSLKCDRSTAAGGRSQASINNRGLRSPRRCRRGRRRKSSGREMGPSRNGAMTDDSPHPPSPPKRLNGDGALGPVPFFMPGSPTPHYPFVHPSRRLRRARWPLSGPDGSRPRQRRASERKRAASEKRDRHTASAAALAFAPAICHRNPAAVRQDSSANPGVRCAPCW